MNKNTVVFGTLFLGLVGLAFIIYLNMRPTPPIPGVVQFPRPSAGHDNSVSYPFEQYPLPPAGGLHYDVWQNCGIYETVLNTPNAIHSLEHGAVWIAYQEGLSADEIDKLQSYARNQTFLLVSPYPNLKSPIVLSAWGLQLELDDADDKRIEQFISRYRLGPQTPERGAACDRGIGNPLQ